jgi:selenocysteine-specific translation elongation factor
VESVRTNAVHFEVTDCFSVTGQGAFVAGNVVSGILRVGMDVFNPRQHDRVTIRQVEFLDRIATHTTRVALALTETATEDELRALFPVGSVIEFR